VREGRVVTRREYVRRLLGLGRRHGEIPVYGSPEWEALPPADPRKFAAVVRAAECWRLDGEPDAVRRRLADDDLLVRARVRLASYDVADATDWTDAAGRPSWAELQRRRELVA
jgi:hypothetical protein